MADFFREVDEDYRRDRLVNVWVKYKYAFIAAAVLVVAATAGWRMVQHFRTAAAESAGAQYEAALRLSAAGKSVEAQAAFEALAKTGPKGYATLARLYAVDEIAGRDPAGAIAAFEALAADPAYDQAFRDVARARAAILSVDSDDPKVFEQKFGPLAAPNFTYRNAVRELLALAAFKRDDMEAAGRWLDMIVADARAPSALRQRAEAFLGLVQAGKVSAPPAPASAVAPEPPSPPAPSPAESMADRPAPTPAAPASAGPEKAPEQTAPSEDQKAPSEHGAEKAPVEAAPNY